MKTQKEQYELLMELQSNGFNIVTCGNCGAVVIHRTKMDELSCYECGFTSDPCDFPDLQTEINPRYENGFKTT